MLKALSQAITERDCDGHIVDRISKTAAAEAGNGPEIALLGLRGGTIPWPQGVDLCSVASDPSRPQLSRLVLRPSCAR